MRLPDRTHRLIAEAQLLVPVDVTALAESLGVAVWESPFLEDGVSGKLFRDRRHGGPSGYSILVNSAEPYTRKRFTVAHEIAHFLLHLDRVGDGVVEDAWFRGRFGLAVEREANRLAAELLMPARHIERLVREGVVESEELAGRFHVSEHAMRIQLGQRGFAPKR